MADPIDGSAAHAYFQAKSEGNILKFIKTLGRWALKALIGLVVLGALFAALILFLTRQERPLAHQFFAHLNERDVAAAQAMMREDFVKTYPAATMQAQISRLEPITKVRISNVSVTNGVTIIAGSLNAENGCQSRFELKFIDELIVAFQIPDACLSAEQGA